MFNSHHFWTNCRQFIIANNDQWICTLLEVIMRDNNFRLLDECEISWALNYSSGLPPLRFRKAKQTALLPVRWGNVPSFFQPHMFLYTFLNARYAHLTNTRSGSASDTQCNKESTEVIWFLQLWVNSIEYFFFCRRGVIVVSDFLSPEEEEKESDPKAQLFPEPLCLQNLFSNP